ncbi:MAG: bifunctional 4-hydroxy-2-oxoglutarate aldolase/2-dehydro-3-deoxy-phosphogluconate aldolase [Flavobacteriia bacterium]|nr:MAG: bifunctional 4-hydroxy-2-oxoglutarate aldolase/2-dehydro-3-deoxy-phosphogluconate aldolase [Flavobacteriia bacterium]
MMKYTRIEVVQRMLGIGLIPLYYHPDVELGKKVIKACYDSGAHLLEFTARGDFAHEVFSELNRFAKEELPEMVLGVGSVTDSSAASLYMQLGANFIVTPSLREDIAMVCNRRKILYLPGCGSLTEINRAEELGAEIVKLFPGSSYGPDFVKAIKGPQPWTNIMPTGGVGIDEENLMKWFKAGVSCVGVGSNLISKEILEKQNFNELEYTISKTLNLIRQLK